MKIKASILFLTIAFFGCDPVDNLEVVNRSSDTIFFELSYNRKLESYPIQRGASGDTLWQHMNFVYPRDSAELPLIGRNAWRNFINKKSTDSTLTIFVFERGLLKSVAPDSLVAKQLYSKKFFYTVKDLEKLKWRVEYQ